MITETQFILPDLLANWPFDCQPNPHQGIVADSTAWVESFDAFDAKAQDAFNRCKFGIFSSLAYPNARSAHFRVVCDLMNLFFVFDEKSDGENGQVVAQQAADIMGALRNPHAPPPSLSQSLLGAMTQDFWQRTLECASSSSAERFIRNFDEYTDAVRRQAVDRDCGRTRSVEEYFELRRGTIGVRPSFDYFLLLDDIPDEVISHPQIEKLAIGAIDMTILANDVYSYNVEQSRGDDEHNIISVAMREKGLSIQGAMDHVGELYAKISQEFCEDFKHLPTYPEPLNKLVKEYAWGMGNWVTTNIKWSFASERYFGSHGAVIAAHRTVQLRPKV